jgi:outer membrane protein assembly factor BamA
MTKLHYLIAAFLLLTVIRVNGQQYKVAYFPSEGSPAYVNPGLQESFESKTEASTYLARLPFLLQSKGYITASVDSLSIDSLKANVYLYLGKLYSWGTIASSGQHASLLQSLNFNWFKGKFDMGSLQLWQQQVLDHLEEKGYPFARVFLDSISIEDDKVKGLLSVDPGPLYKIDSIRLYGDARVDNDFLQRYLGISNGSIYDRRKLNSISRKLARLNFLEEERPSDLSLLGTGSVLNLYLKPRKSSQVNALIGLLPNSNQLSGDRKLLLTVDANILIRNAFNSGETIGFIWQQLQPSSPRLNLLFEKPYMFRTNMGLNFSLDMYKRDSSFLNLNMNLGTLHTIDENRSVTIYIQRRQSIISGFNTARIVQTRQLPDEIDVSSINLGTSFTYSSTDYRFNPRKGTELNINGSAGNKSIKKNPEILELKDPSDPLFKFERLYDTLKMKSYQFRITASGAHFFPLGGQSAIKTGVNAGIFQSPGMFRNELFQIGGFRLLRGFDEESEFVSAYAVGIVEYRYLVDRNSNFFIFSDGGYGKKLNENRAYNLYLGVGAGFSFETKAGILNLAWAIGKRDDLEFNLRQSKVHIGFASYF